jgi:hypothetical protein
MSSWFGSGQVHAKLAGAALDHAPGVDPVHRRGRERAGAADGRAEQGTPFVAGDARGTEIFVEEGFELVMGRHFVALAAFLVQADPPALIVGEIILDPHRHHGADGGEGVGHDADQRAVAEADEGRGVDASRSEGGIMAFGIGGDPAALRDRSPIPPSQGPGDCKGNEHSSLPYAPGRGAGHSRHDLDSP